MKNQTKPVYPNTQMHSNVPSNVPMLQQRFYIPQYYQSQYYPTLGVQPGFQKQQPTSYGYYPYGFSSLAQKKEPSITETLAAKGINNTNFSNSEEKRLREKVRKLERGLKNKDREVEEVRRRYKKRIQNIEYYHNEDVKKLKDEVKLLRNMVNLSFLVVKGKTTRNLILGYNEKIEDKFEIKSSYPIKIGGNSTYELLELKHVKK